MRSAGIDIGSRTVKLVLVENGQVLFAEKADSSYDPITVANGLLDKISYDSLVATGYGRHFFNEHFTSHVISEIKAFAMGVKSLFPEAMTVLDIGGQDTKVISMNQEGRIVKFEMNDRCAAGTGRFLELMANALHYNITEFGDAALNAEKAVKISSMCTVFAESEVISLTTRGAKREEVALGLHQSIIHRVLTMLGRLPRVESLVFAGGVAFNPCIRRLLEENLQISMMIPEDPQIVGALGAAMHGIVVPDLNSSTSEEKP
jgi:(R)-2-hydroxyacyl-CoA dehydratese activating ATPase